MRLVVQTIHIPAWSTIGFGSGIDSDTGERVTFCGDHADASVRRRPADFSGSNPR